MAKCSVCVARSLDSEVTCNFLAGAVGFEPTNADSKNRCSTLWSRKIVRIPVLI